MKSLPEQEIRHCVVSMDSAGGKITYVRALLQSGMPGVGNQPITSLAGVDQSRFRLLHVHDPEILRQTQDRCPVVFTAHNHDAYCPSGSRHLEAREAACDRRMSIPGCLWGHLVDHCGSRRPQRILENFKRAYATMEFLGGHPGIHVIAPSDFVREQFLRHGLVPERVTTLLHGVASAASPTAPLSEQTHGLHRVLFAGRITPEKGLAWLLRALARTNRTVQLDIAGDGHLRPRMERLIDDLDLRLRVTWHGWCDTQQMQALYERCFALIVPSTWHEPAGLVTLEAYTHHRPVIASALGALPEYVADQKTGILVPGENVEKLAAAIDELFSDYDRCRGMGEAGRRMFESQFTLKKHLQQLQSVYTACIQNLHFRPDSR